VGTPHEENILGTDTKRILACLDCILAVTAAAESRLLQNPNASLKVRVGFEVLTAVVTKNFIFWDITPCSSLKVNRRFGRNIIPPSSGSQNKPSKNPASSR
jgi:hypothetical protein